MLGADVAFVRKDRVERAGISRGYRFGAPDLVVEVISPSDNMKKVEQKVQRWLSAGARIVWTVDPKTRTIKVYEGTDKATVREDDELTGGDVVPGFRLPVAEIFI